MTTRLDRAQRRQLSLLLRIVQGGPHGMPIDELLAPVYDYHEKIRAQGGQITTTIRKLLERDLGALKTAGFDVQVRADRYLLPETGQALKNLVLTGPQIAALELAINNYTDTADAQLLLPALAKIQAATGIAVQLPTDATEAGNNPHTATHNQAHNQEFGTPSSGSRRLWQVISSAITSEQRITFEYRSARSGKLSVRSVSPWQIIIFQQASYLFGYDHDHGSQRVFKFNRMTAQTVRASSEASAWYEPRSSKHSAGDLFIAHQDSQQAVLGIKPELAQAFRGQMSDTHVAEDFIAPAVARQYRRHFGGVIVINFNSTFNLIQQLLQYGTAVKALYPPALVAEIRHTIAAARDLEAGDE